MNGSSAYGAGKKYTDEHGGGGGDVTKVYVDEQDNAIRQDLKGEVNRAKTKENELNNAIIDEVSRATNEENALNKSISDEITRAKNKENEINKSISDEITRAKNIENGLEKNKLNKTWNYIGVLSASVNSTLTIPEDKRDFNELLVVAVAVEGSSKFNYGQIVPKEVMSVGSPNGFYIIYNYGNSSNTSYNSWAIRCRMKYENGILKNTFITSIQWTCAGFYIYVR